jgi:peptidase A4-like protein
MTREFTASMPAETVSVLTVETDPFVPMQVSVAGASGAPIRAHADRDGHVDLYVVAQGGVREVELVARSFSGEVAVEMPVTIRVGKAARGESLLPTAAAFRLGLDDPARRELREQIDPYRMTDDELQDLGYPPRPDRRRPELLASWRAIVDLPYVPMRTESIPFDRLGTSVRQAQRRPPVTLVEGTSAVISPSWAGRALAASKGSFGFVDGFWTVPSVWSDLVLATTAAAAWVGLNGLSGGVIVQTGTDSQVQDVYPDGGGYGDRVLVSYHYSWNEWWPEKAIPTGVPVGAGDRIYARAWINGKQSNYFFANMTNGQTAFSVYQPTAANRAAFNGQSAEWIVERPLLAGTQLPLAKFNPIQFTYMSANDGNLAGLPKAPPSSQRDVIMFNANRLLAYPDNGGGDSTVIGVRQQ